VEAQQQFEQHYLNGNGVQDSTLIAQASVLKLICEDGMDDVAGSAAIKLGDAYIYICTINST
jgi:hypothetical protein